MSQVKQGKTKKGILMSVNIPKLDTKPTKRNESPFNTKVRPGAISRSIPPQEVSQKKELPNTDMLHTNNAYKLKKLGVSNTPQFLDSHKPIDQHSHKQSDPPKKSKSHASSITTNSHTKPSYHDQATGTFKTKAEKKSMPGEKLEEKIGEDLSGNTYLYTGGKKIFKIGPGKQERELVSNGSKDCGKLVKNLRVSSKNQDLISRLELSILPRIQAVSKSKSSSKDNLHSESTNRLKESTEWNSKKSQKTHSSSLFQSSLEAKQKSSVKNSILTDSTSSLAKNSFEDHTQVHSSLKKDSVLSKSRDPLSKPALLHKQTSSLVDHKQSPDFSNSPHKLTKLNSIESSHSPADIKHIDPSNIPNEVTPTQRKKRGRPPGPSEKTKKKLAINKPLSIQTQRGRPKKPVAPILSKLKTQLGSPNITADYSKKFSNPIRVSKPDFKKQKNSDKQIFYEVQETSDSMLKEDMKRGDDLKRSDNKDTERDKMKQNFVSKTSNSHYTPANPKLKENMQSPTARKRPPLLSSSSENEDSESSSSKPPPSKTPNFRSSKSSESDTPDIPKTPGPSSTAPSLWGDLDVDLKNETTKSSKPKITASPYRKATETLTVVPAPSRGKYMPKKNTQQKQQQEKSPPQLTAKPVDTDTIDSLDLPVKSKIRTADVTKPHYTGKKIVAAPKPAGGQKLTARPRIESQKDTPVNSQPSAAGTTATLSSEESSSDSSDTDSTSSSDESDESPTVSNANKTAQPSTSQTNPGVKPPPSGPEHPRVAYVFTTELANKAAAAVSRGEVRNIVEYHQKYQPALSHLKLSTERRQNLEKRTKSPGQNGSSANVSGKKIAEKTLAAPDTSTSESSSSSDEDTESSEQESRPPSPAIHKPVPNKPAETCEEPQDNSDASSDQQELMSPLQMIPKTPGPPPGKKFNSSDDDSDEGERPAQRLYRGKSQMNVISGRDTDTSDMQDDYGKMDICPKTPGAGLMLKHLQPDDDDDEVEANGMSDKELSDDDKTRFYTFDQPPRAPRPRIADDEEETHTRSDFSTRPTSPQFDNVLKGINSAQNSLMPESPSISPLLDLQIQARPPPLSLPNITPRPDWESPYRNTPPNPAASSTNPSAKSTPNATLPMGSGSNDSSYTNHFQISEQTNTNLPTPLDNRAYPYPSVGHTQYNIEQQQQQQTQQPPLPQQQQPGKSFAPSHFPSPSRTPLHSTPPRDPLSIRCSTPSQQPSSLHEAMTAPYRTADTRRSSCGVKTPLSELPPGEIGMLPTATRKDSIDSNSGLYQQRFPMGMPYYFPNKTQTFPSTPPINISYSMLHSSLDQTQYKNGSSPLYIQDTIDMTSSARYQHPTDSLPVSMHLTPNTGQYYPNTTTGYSRMPTPRRDTQPQELPYSMQSALPAQINRQMVPSYVNGDNIQFNGISQQLVPPANLIIENDPNSLARTFSEFSTPNLQGTPIDTNIANLNPTLGVPDPTPPDQRSASIRRQDSFTFSEPTQSPRVATISAGTSPPPPPRHTTSCSTSPPPQPVPKPTKPHMVSTYMQTDGDDTWDNSNPEMDAVLEQQTEDVSLTATMSSAECQTELAPQVPKVAETTRPVVWDPSTGQKQEEEEGLIIRIPTKFISKETKFLNGKISDDFVNISELPKLTPLNLKDREKFLMHRLGAMERHTVSHKKYYNGPPPLRCLLSAERDMPQLRPIKILRANGFGPSDQVELDFRDLPKLRPLNPRLLVNNS